MTPAPQDVRKKGSEILKLRPVRNCFTLTMTYKLVVIINSLKYQKLRKFYYSIWNEISCTKLQLPPEPLTKGLLPPDPRPLCPLSLTEFVEPPWKKFLGTPQAGWGLVISSNLNPLHSTYLVSPLARYQMKQPVTYLLQTLDSSFLYIRIQALVSWRDKCLKVNGDYMEVWCVPSATHVPCIHWSQS